MHSQIHRGISLIILPLPSERDGERLLFPHSVLSNTSGNLANCSPSPFGEGWGEAPFSHSVLSNTPGYLANYPPSPFGEGWGEAPFSHSDFSNTTGYLANCPPSPFGEGWGEAASGVFQAASSLDNQGRKRAYRTTFSAHKRKKRPRIAARPPPKSSI